jgi:hypothetical protein
MLRFAQINFRKYPAMEKAGISALRDLPKISYKDVLHWYLLL